MQGLEIGLFVIDMCIRFKNSKTVVVMVSIIVYQKAIRTVTVKVSQGLNYTLFCPTGFNFDTLKNFISI